MKTQFSYKDSTFDIELTKSGKSYRAVIGNMTCDVELPHSEGGQLDLLINGKRITTHISSENAKRWVTIGGRTFVLTKQTSTRPRGGAGGQAAGRLTAPMPGQVRAVNVSEGDAVTKGQTLVVLEAMKMEIRIQSPVDGVVKSLAVKQGQTVEREQELVRVEGQTSQI